MKYLSVLLSSLILAACGGGGGGGAPAPATPVASTSTFQLKQAYTNDLNDTRTYSFTLSGTVTSGANTGTVTGNGSIARGAPTNVTFEGATALSKTITTTGTITVTVGASSASQALPPTISSTYVSPTFDLVGFTSAGAYSAPSGAVNFPTTARVGDSGTVGTFNTYASAARGPIQGTNVLSWSLGADTASTAILTLTQTIRNAGGIVTTMQVENYRLTPAGAVTPINAVATVTGVGTLTYTF